MFIAHDGGLESVAYGALGSRWSMMKFTGEAVHTLNSRKAWYFVRAAAECITEIYTIPLPSTDAPVQGYYNVGGIIQSGEVFNAIPSEVSFSVDLRTVDPELLQSLDDAIIAKCDAAAKTHGVLFSRQIVQKQEAGGRPEQLRQQRAHPLVQTAIDALRFVGAPVAGQERRRRVQVGRLIQMSEYALGIPSIAFGPATGGDAHSVREWANVRSAKMGTKAVILVAVAMASPVSRK